jgi:hypothetical protein
MGEILGLGITHQPTLAAKQFRPVSLWRAISDPLLPPHLKEEEAWPERLRKAWGSDRGLTACEQHRQEILAQFAIVRRALDAFQPDVVLIWGDDQFENFKSDIIPAFCVLAVDEFSFAIPQFPDQPNAWDEPEGTRYPVKGHKAAGKHLASSLLRDGFDVAYAYQPLHNDLAIAFSRSILYMDWPRTGFPYALVPVSVNCYGSRVTVDHGLPQPLAPRPLGPDELDPPAPSPQRCFALGAATARAFRDSPWRVALVASSSWSHAFLTEKNHKMLPDLDADLAMFASLQQGDFAHWRDKSLEEIEASGQHEMLNWYCLAGAMTELGRRAAHTAFLESSVANSNKVMAIFPQ